MKKLSYTTILAAACLLLPGCSDDAADKGLVSPDVLVADSEVEIKLSSNSSNLVTRAGVYEGEGEEEKELFSTPTECYVPNKQGVLEKTEPKLMLFCLATGIQEEAIDPSPISWAGSTEQTNLVKWVNRPSKVWKGNIKLDVPDFYPSSNWYTYSFYGLYTKQPNALTRRQDNIAAYVWMNGYDDIIWGKSYVNDNDPYKEYAYSAKYYRNHIKADNDPSDYPAQMQFKHLLTCFQFQVKAMDQNASGMEITSIKLLNHPSYVQLTIASNNPAIKEGEFFDHPNPSYPPIQLYDVEIEKDEVNQTLKEILTPATFAITDQMIEDQQPVVIGGSADPAAFYVLPKQEKYTFEVEMKKGNNTFTSQLDIIPDVNDNVGAGVRNIIDLFIYGPQEISLEATLDPWVDGDGHEFEL